MNLQEFFAFVRRQYLIVLLIVVTTIIATGAIASQQPPRYQTTLLYAVSVKGSEGTERSFDITKVADDFARTVTGWTKSATLGEKISALSEADVTISATPQAKQNFLVFLSFADQNSADRITVAADQSLQDEVRKYNSASENQFALTRHGETNASALPNLITVLVAAGIGGWILALSWLALQSYMGERATSIREAEQILRTQVAVTFRKSTDPEIAFLDVLLGKLGKHVVLAGIDTDVKKIAEKLGEKVAMAKLPDDSATLGRGELALVVIVKLDTSRLSTLRQVRALVDGEIKLVVWG